MKELVFCAGLPRTGSTVLMNILQQNPKVFTTSTCPLTNIIRENILLDTKKEITFKSMESKISDIALYNFIHGATRGWYENLTDKPIVISKNRTWSEIFHLYPNNKFIFMIRDLRDIVDSFEKLNSTVLCRHNANVTNNRLLPVMSDREKYDYYFNSPNSLSNALSHVKRFIELYESNLQRIYFISYETLINNPIAALNNIYSFLNERPFDHDLNNISQSELYEHDNVYQQEFTCHQTKPKLDASNVRSKRYLCNDFYNLILDEYKWFYQRFYPGVFSNAK